MFKLEPDQKETLKGFTLIAGGYLFALFALSATCVVVDKAMGR